MAVFLCLKSGLKGLEKPALIAKIVTDRLAKALPKSTPKEGWYAIVKKGCLRNGALNVMAEKLSLDQK